MRNTNRKIRSPIMIVLSLSAIVGSFLVVMAQEPLRQRDALAPLKRALSEAAAPALTSQQEERLTSIVTNFRNKQRSQRPDETLEAARRAYEEAILTGNSEAAKSQANIIAEQMTAHVREQLQAEADLKIQILSVLTESQKSSLRQAVGGSGLVGLLSAGGRRPHGPGGPGGPGGFPPHKQDDDRQ